MNILRNATAAFMLQGEEDHGDTVHLKDDAAGFIHLKDAAAGLGIHMGAAVNYWPLQPKTRE